MVVPQEGLYDEPDLRPSAAPTDTNVSSETQLVSKCGHLEVAFAYDAPMRKMTVRVLQARDIPTRDRGGSANTQVINQTFFLIII